MERDTWVEVQQDSLRLNYRSVSKAAGVKVCAVVKANAYGHGLVAASRIFKEEGAHMLAVSRLGEAQALRDADIDGPILVMVPPVDPTEATALGTDFAWDDVSSVADLPAGARVHLKVDVGMGRLGVSPAGAVETATQLATRGLLAGVMTHLPQVPQAASKQAAQFNEVVSQLRTAGIEAPAHASNSAALVSLPELRHDMVRVGTLLYGQHPASAKAPWELHPTFDWFASVSSVKTIAAKTSVGYGSEWVAKRSTRIATLPVGWSDGFMLEPQARTASARETLARISRASKALGRDPRVLFLDGLPVPVLGRVGMQTVTVEAKSPKIVVGSVAKIPSRRLLVSPLIPRILK